MSSANQFGKTKRSIKRQMAIARKSRSVRRNIEDNDMIEDRSSDTDSDATIIIDTDPIPSTSSDESSLSIDDVTISRSEMKISSLRSPIRTSNKEDWNPNEDSDTGAEVSGNVKQNGAHDNTRSGKAVKQGRTDLTYNNSDDDEDDPDVHYLCDNCKSDSCLLECKRCYKWLCVKCQKVPKVMINAQQI